MKIYNYYYNVLPASKVVLVELNWFPFGGKNAISLFPFLFVKKSFVENIPAIQYEYLLKHEKVHLLSQKQMGFFNFMYSYRKDVEFRFWHEMNAFKHDLFYYIQVRGYEPRFAISEIARTMSSKVYEMCSFQRAYSELLSYYENNKRQFI